MMNTMTKKHATVWMLIFWLTGTAIASFVVFSIVGCVPYANTRETPSSHGLRTFETMAMVSFVHTGTRVCVPKGWQAVGALSISFGGALFEREKTGVLIDADAFSEEQLSLEQPVGYSLRVIYPNNTPKDALAVYRSMIASAFSSLASQYRISGKDVPHDIVITYGVLEHEALYPDPNAYVTYLTLPPDDSRTEELVLHAIAHLYNRFDSRFTDYTARQSPLSSGDFEELEATWSETAFRTSVIGKRARLAYLYSEYTETTGAYTDLEAKKHYIVFPLTMIAVEGLLQQLNTGTSVKELFARTHQGSGVNFFEALRAVLPETEMVRIIRWLSEEERIPYDLLLSGIRFYETTSY